MVVPAVGRHLRGRRGAGLVLGVALVAMAWWQVLGATAGIEVETRVHGEVPITVLVPTSAVRAPAVVVVHGFSGSALLMRSFGLALASAGQVVALPELPGHGANPAQLPLDDDGRGLTDAVGAAVEVVLEQSAADPQAVVLLGHSMGSGAILRAGVDDPDTYAAVVAVSPTDAEVTSSAPPNLLLLAGEFEPRFVANAQDLLERAGGPSRDLDDALAAGTARALEIVPGVEHVGILFSPHAHRVTARWVQTATGRDIVDPVTHRLIVWWLLQLLGVVLVWRAVATLAASPALTPERRGRPLVGLVAGAAAATALLAVVARVVDVSAVGSMLVAPVLALWFGLAGAVWLWSGARAVWPDGRDLGWGAVALGVLVLAFGVVGARVWLPWFTTAGRAGYALPLAAATLPWTLALGTAIQGRRGLRLAGWWAAISLTVLVWLGVAVGVVPGLGFVALLLPLLPALIALVMVVVAPIQRPWATGVAGAAFLGWTMAVLFPLAA
jgi:dienelactone hydrolase